jgi:predicted nucleic acid-binding protein
VSAYADTSFLVSLYVPDVNSADAARLIRESDDKLFVTPFNEAEFTNTIELRVFRKDASQADAEASFQSFRADVAAGSVLVRTAVPGSAYARSVLLSRQYTRELGTRALDVLHVAIALELGVRHFFTFDKPQAKLAKRCGLSIRPRR